LFRTTYKVPLRLGGEAVRAALPTSGSSGKVSLVRIGEQRRDRAIRILLTASEVVGFAKTGGLADVAGALPPALAHRGHDVAVVMPLYQCARKGAVPVEQTSLRFRVPVGDRGYEGRIWQSHLPDSDVPVYLIEQPDFFDRDTPALGHGLYQFTPTGGGKRDYPDNCSRFLFLCRAVCEVMRLTDFWPDVLHVNDWQTAFAPVFLREVYCKHPDLDLRPHYRKVRVLLTLHNLAYQGSFWHWDMQLTDLDWSLFNPSQLEFYGNLNLLKAGIVYSDLLNTVSPTYAREIQTPYYGCGLQAVLSERRDRLSGIVNGVDYGVWDPSRDKRLAATYDADQPQPGKARCKEALQRQEGLDPRPDAPLLGVVARLAEQKGIDLIAAAVPALLDAGAQLVVLGDGEPWYQHQLEALRGRYPGKVALSFKFDETLAHRIEAGSDLFLMPSRYEPSGLNQLYSLRYGTPPVVRATGGLADSVTDTTPETLAAGTATGFSFIAQTPEALRDTTMRALTIYRDRPNDWKRIMATGMRQDWSWDRSAAEYERLYERLAVPQTVAI
jgi:starch synthase